VSERHTGCAGDRVEQGGLDGGLGPEVAGARPGHPRRKRIPVITVRTDEHRREDLLDTGSGTRDRVAGHRPHLWRFTEAGGAVSEV
jgi:hypothetical protein